MAGALSDAQIASHLGVARSFVRYWRKRLSSKCTVALTGNIPDEIVLNAVKYMHANLGSDLNVAKLARQVGTSPPNLRRRFREAKQLGPHALLTDLRMERARELLYTSHVTLKEIAYQLGYRRPDEFSRAFARVHGITPSEWRQARAHPKCR
jgi:transcriptional regulator GlxA family with amidase domain